MSLWRLGLEGTVVSYLLSLFGISCSGMSQLCATRMLNQPIEVLRHSRLLTKTYVPAFGHGSSGSGGVQRDVALVNSLTATSRVSE